MKPFGLYIHIPYCLQRCPYCDFNTYATAALPEKEYIAALLCELDYRASEATWSGREIGSIYFGGGTPSLLSSASIDRFLDFVSATFPLQPLTEITLEANPGTVSGDKLAALHEAGINRLSLGVQSFNTRMLGVLGRIHTPEQCESAICDGRSAGFKNLSLDLIYGIPGQTGSDWKADLKTAVSYAPEHISAYGLTIEKGTPFYEQCKKGAIKLPAESVIMKMMGVLNTTLTENGFRRYEISNYARPGREARHNLAYWSCRDYLGLGAGAHSFVSGGQIAADQFGCRWANFAEPEKYMRETTTHGHAVSWRENLNRKAAMFEFFFLGLRKVEGVNTDHFRERFAVGVEDVYPSVVDILKEQKYVATSGSQLFLTERGFMLADSVFEFFAEDKDSSAVPAVPDPAQFPEQRWQSEMP